MILFGKTKFRASRRGSEPDYTYKNPGRGWYRPYPFYLGRELDEAYLDTVLSEREQICLVELVLDKNSQSSDADLRGEVRDIFAYFQKRQKDIVVRATYDLEGQAMVREPETLAGIYQAMEIVAAIELEFKDIILIHQGLFIGNWGEMHSSRYSGKSSLIKLYRHWDSLIKGAIPVAVRTPAQMQQLLGLGDTPISIFDDAMCSTITDMGTFNVEIRDRELDYIADHVVNLHVGGEVVYTDAGIGTEASAELMDRMCVSYLNSQYDVRLLSKWRHCKLLGTSMFDFVDRHMGYAFEVEEVTWDTNSSFLYCEIINLGFGKCMLEGVTAQIGLRHRNDAEIDWGGECSTGIKCREYYPGKTGKIKKSDKSCETMQIRRKIADLKKGPTGIFARLLYRGGNIYLRGCSEDGVLHLGDLLR